MHGTMYVRVHMRVCARLRAVAACICWVRAAAACVSWVCAAAACVCWVRAAAVVYVTSQLRRIARARWMAERSKGIRQSGALEHRARPKDPPPRAGALD